MRTIFVRYCLKLDYHLEDLDRALTMMSSLLNSMVEEMETEFTDIRAKVKSISKGVEVADTIEIAAIKNRLIKIKYELIAVDILSQKIENRRNNLWLEFDFTYMDFSVRAYSALRRAGYKTLAMQQSSPVVSSLKRAEYLELIKENIDYDCLSYFIPSLLIRVVVLS